MVIQSGFALILFNMRKVEKIIIICKNCGVETKAYPFEKDRKHFCSRHCNCQFNMKGKKYCLGKKLWLGKKHTEESKEKNRLSNLGRRSSVGTEFKKGLIPWNKGKPFLQISGENHPNWQGGITKESFKIRNSFLYKQWRDAIYKRDNYTCTCCGEKEKVSGKLEAHHIKSFADFPELRFDIDNGRTLCKDCHRKTDTYLNKGRCKNKKAA